MLSLLLALVSPAAARAELAPIGLSEVRAQAFASPVIGNRVQFAGAFAAGDFDGDQVEDLATGAPGDDDAPNCPDPGDCGTVQVRFGVARSGLGATTAILKQPPGANESNDQFGSSLAAGDFDGDSFDDLAVGVPGNDDAAGAVYVFFGGDPAFVRPPEVLVEATAGEPIHICPDARFGWTLEAGNFNGDGRDDLAIGAPFACELVDEALVRAGSVFVAQGTADGLVPWFGYRISQNSLFISGDEACEEDDWFGYALAAGNFVGSTHDDLAISIPGEDEAGAMEVIFGSQFGLIYEYSVFWYPGALGEAPEPDDLFGLALVAGRFDDDPYSDLAIGTPFEDSSAPVEIDAGSIAIAYGGVDDFDLARTHRLSQSSLTQNPKDEEAGDYFGGVLAAGDFDGDGLDDLAVAHYGEDGEVSDQGALSVVMGAAGGLGASTRYRILTKEAGGLPGGAPLVRESFGAALATGDFDGTGFADLAIGLPGRGSLADPVESELVLYGALFADGFEIETPYRWSAVVQ